MAGYRKAPLRATNNMFLKNLFGEYRGITVAFFVTVILFLPLSCKREKTDILPNFSSRDSVPGMRADSIVTLISDSGRIRYKVITATWLIYDQAPDPYWFFPEKIYFERFDDSMRIESIVKSDTARYYTKRKLWELKKNVQVMNLAGEKFETPLLYWDQNQHRIYSDSFIRIEQQDWISTGMGFESNESMTVYSILNSKGDFPIDSEEENQEQ